MSFTPSKKWWALADCNNFYASCERLFRPDWAHRPLIVLSNNDGCVVARSNEAKALGIAMGTPFFQIRSLCQQKKVQVCSSNYALYGDLSQRVMHSLATITGHIEVYSIDEAFIPLPPWPRCADRIDLGQHLQDTVQQWTGISLSIGIGPTQTLAKVANALAKKQRPRTVIDLCEEEQRAYWLPQVGIQDVWGIGTQWATMLTQHGILTAWDWHQYQNTHQHHYNVVLRRIACELRGIPCLSLEHPSHKQIMASRSFPHPITDRHILLGALAQHCARAAEKLRHKQLTTAALEVFVRHTSVHHPAVSVHTALVPTDQTAAILQTARSALARLYQPHLRYRKVGVILRDLAPPQTTLFTPEHEQIDQRITDPINHRFGRGTVSAATQLSAQQSSMRSSHRSPSYTTQWGDLPRVE